MNTEYVYMNVILLGILTVVAGIISIGFAIVFFADTEYHTSGDKKKPRWAFLSLICLCLFSGGLTWWIHSGNQPWRTELMSFHEIKEVTWPDGSKVQMFTCDGKHYNVTEIFGKVVDVKEWHIRRVRWSPVYAGLSWSGSERCKGGDRFFLESKTGDQELNVAPEKSGKGAK